MARPSAIIIGCEGAELSPAERRLIARHNPLGLIVFRRNCLDPMALQRLTAEFRALVGRADAPVMIDQEGGRVQRIRPPAGPDMPAPRGYGQLHRRDPERALGLAFAHGRITGLVLAEFGINVNAAPVLDLAFDGASAVVGDRAFDGDPQRVAALGRAMTDGMASAGVAAVMKHMPGHGRATVDSHHGLPCIDIPTTALKHNDFKPFAALSDLSWGMTAHVLYPQIDPHLPATLSSTIIRTVIRGTIGFDGILTTDDLAMGALMGEPGERVAQCLDAGCDVALYCDPAIDRLASALEAARPLDDAAAARLAKWQAPHQPKYGTPAPSSPSPADGQRAAPTRWQSEFAAFTPPPPIVEGSGGDAPGSAATPVADR